MLQNIDRVLLALFIGLLPASVYLVGCDGGSNNNNSGEPVAAFSITSEVTESTYDVIVDTSESSGGDGGAIETYSIDWGDGSSLSEGTGTEYMHSYPLDESTYTITLTITNTEGANATSSQQIVASAADGNQAPVIDLQANITQLSSVAFEVTVDLTGSTDDGSIVVYTAHAGGSDYPVENNSGTFAFYYGPGTYTITATVEDNEGLTSTQTFTFNTDDYLDQSTPPVATVSVASTLTGENTYTVTLDTTMIAGGTDINGDAIAVQSFVINWGDGNSDTVLNDPDEISHIYSRDGQTYTITVTVTNSEGDETTFSLDITTALPADGNFPPEVVLQVTVLEDLEYFDVSVDLTLSGDEDGTIVSYTVDWGDGSDPVTVMPPDAALFSRPIDYNQGVIYITATLTDDDGATSSDSYELDTSHGATDCDTTEVTHNSVTYCTVTSPATGRVWLDRNLGASQVCETTDDEACFGGYYQWGRRQDGHELSTSTTTSVQPATLEELATTGAEFITGGSSSFYDWANTADPDGSVRSAYWSLTDGNAVCPVGYRVPTGDELAAETTDQGLTNAPDAFDSFLKLPTPYFRDYSDGAISTYASEYGRAGGLWAADIGYNSSVGQSLYYDTAGLGLMISSTSQRGTGVAVRCIQD